VSGQSVQALAHDTNDPCFSNFLLTSGQFTVTFLYLLYNVNVFFEVCKSMKKL
jgi:hypothetical protein